MSLAPDPSLAPRPLAADAVGDLITAAGPARLDVRSDAAFAAGHVAGSGHVPLALLEARRTELPARETPIVVLGEDADEAREAAARLVAMGYVDVAWLDGPIAALGARAAVRGPAELLWRPNAFLAEILDRIPRGPAADLAAGSGRDAAFLALHGFEVEAWDEAPEALAWGEAMAARAGVSIATRVANLEARHFTLPESRYTLVTCFRFLHRPLFPVMARALAPGGHLVYETYRLGQERYGRPRRPQFLLGPGELARAFGGLGLEVLRFEETDPEGGPLTQRIWARWPPGSSGAGPPP